MNIMTRNHQRHCLSLYFILLLTTLISSTSMMAESTPTNRQSSNMIGSFAADDIITFADQTVKNICLNHWDSNGDGELSVSEASAVTKISSEFYNNRDITSFEELRYFTNVTEIAVNAFYDCRALTSISFPESLTSIGDKAFFNCYSLKEIYIPASVSSIGLAAFSCCYVLNKIEVDTANSYYDSRENCNAIIEKNTMSLIAGCNNTVIPEGVTAIESEAFRGMFDLKDIQLPSSLKTIAGYAFYYCTGLTGHLSIPEGVSSIGTYAFYKCTGLTSIELPSTLTEITHRMFYKCDNISTMKVNWTVPPSVSSSFFTNYSNCVLKVPEGCVEAYKAASVWNKFKEIVEDGEYITFADPTVKSICLNHWDSNGDGELSMSEASAVTKINSEFYNNREIISFDELKYFTNVTEIAGNAFYDCRALASITFPQSLNTIGDRAFYNGAAIREIKIPSSVSSIGSAVFSCCTILNKIEVDPQNAYYDSRNDCNAIIEKATGKLIAGCNNSTIPEGVLVIGAEAFRGMFDLEGITLPKTLTSIGDRAFYYCQKLTGNLAIPEGVVEVGTYAFYKCTGLTSIELPSTLEDITHRMLHSCDNVSTLKVNWRTPPSVSSEFFTNYSNCILKVPEGCVETYKVANVWKKFKEIRSDVSYTLTIQSSAGGAVSYNGNKVTNDTQSFSVNEGATVTLNITPDDSFELTKLTVNGADVTTNVTEGQYSISSMAANTTIIAQFTKKTHSLSIQSTGNGKVTYNNVSISNTTQSFTVEEGTSATLFITADNGYRLSSISVNGTNVTSAVTDDSYTINNISVNTSVIAVFEAIPVTTFSLSIQSSAGGTVSYNGVMVSNGSQVFSVSEGATVNLNVTPETGYMLTKLTVNNNDATSSVSGGSISINNISSNTNVVAQFTRITHSLTLESSAGGSLSIGDVSVSDGTQTLVVDDGTSATIDILPDAEFELSRLTLNGADVTSAVTDSKYTISNITTNNTVVAQFTKKTYTLTIQSSGNGIVTYNGNEINNTTQSFSVVHGTTLALSLSANSGHQIATLSVNGKDVTSEINGGIYTINEVTSNMSVVAVFEPIPIITYALSIQSTAGGTVSYNGINVSDGEQTFNVSEGTNVTLDIAPDTGFELTSLLVNGNEVKTSITDGKYTISGFSGNTTVMATFAKRFLILSIEAAGNGTVSYKAETVTNTTRYFDVEYGTTATITINPDNGYQIASVILNGTNVTARVSNGIYTIPEINGNNTIQVTFESIPVTTFTLSIQSSAGGGVTYNGVTVSAAAGTFTVGEGASVTLGIAPEPGFELKSLNVNGNDATHMVSGNIYAAENISQNTTVEVLFEKQAFSLTVLSTGKGNVEYLENVVRNDSQTFNVEYNHSAFIAIKPDEGYRLEQFTVNGNDVTEAVTNNVYTIPNITSAWTVNVVFEVNEFTIDNIKYGNISSKSHEVEVLVGEYSEHLNIPATVRFDDTTWYVTKIADNAFSGNDQLVTVSIPQTVEVCGKNIFGDCKHLCAIIWQPQQPLTNNQTGYIGNSNLLFYTSSMELAPDGIVNVVVNNHASQIKLMENNEFYCPQTFITDKISFTHYYNMETGISESKGWETLVLPFDVKSITHATKGEIVPFATYTSGNGTHPFWLYGYDSVRGFVEANAIEANRPYVISMPNNSRYADEYILSGYVTFSAENKR